MPRELENEGVVPYCPKCEQYRFPQYNVAVSMIVVNEEKDEILLIQQYGRPSYILVAGYVSRGESLEDAVAREVREETGMTVSHMKFNRTQFFEKSDTLMCNFTAFVKDSSELDPNYEVDSYAWFTRDEARANIRPNSLAEHFLVDRAEELFRQGYNCGQSVFAAFADVLGLTVEEAAKIASPFGAGFGKLREVCGAVSGMTLVTGYLKGYSDPADYESKKEVYALIRKMCAEFEERQGSIICRELLGLKKGEDTAEPAIRTEEYYQSRPCIGACRIAAEIVEREIL